ncbi:hypothetical protein [uncultured Shewanella sp.]|uniref:hypothetical protein n=1 Tax=uncultured Shewanella sp. TaxID=173975 RepID=UPI0026048F78|nr:hypothetical protein [uncultured Shewanella sp.]
MTDRYSYIKDFSELSEDIHKGVYQFSISEAVNRGCNLRICVNNKSNCDQILERIFSTQTVNKLRANKPVSSSGVSVSLESPATLKKKYYSQEKWVLLLLFPSPESLQVVEGLDSCEAIIVFSEISHSDHLVRWCAEKEVSALAAEQA